MKRDYYVKTTEDGELHHLFLETEGDVPDKVLLRFGDEMEERGPQLLGYGVGSMEPFKSPYNDEWYELHRESEFTFIIRPRD